MVTSLLFATVTEPLATRVEASWPESAAADVVAAWQDLAPDAPDGVTVNLTLVAEPGFPLRVVVFGAALRGPEPTLALLEGLAAGVGVRPEIRHRVMTWGDLKRSFAGQEPGGAGLTVSRSEFFSRSMSASALATLVNALTYGVDQGRRELNFTAMGGAYNRVAPEASAFVHRSERFLLEHVAQDGDGCSTIPGRSRTTSLPAVSTRTSPIPRSTTGRPPTTAQTSSAFARSNATTIPTGSSAFAFDLTPIRQV